MYHSNDFRIKNLFRFKKMSTVEKPEKKRFQASVQFHEATRLVLVSLFDWSRGWRECSALITSLSVTKLSNPE